MAKARSKTVRTKARARLRSPADALDGPTAAQLANGDYQRIGIIHADTARRATVHINRDSAILERWIAEGAAGFEKGPVQAIRDCQFFWHRLGGPRLTAHYGERMPRGGPSDGVNQADALIELRTRAELVPAPYWQVFENVARWNEPAGVAGSRFANNTAQSIAAAKAIVGLVAGVIALRVGY
jgi:hypothetical protein